MAHVHHHDHNHRAHTPGSFNVAFAGAALINFLFVVVEVIYAFAANSTSLLADAGHNFADVLGLLMAWGANWLLTREASEKYSYGFKKTTILSAMANALLLVASSAIIIYEAIHKLVYPEPVHELVVMIVASIGIVINGGTALLFMRSQKKDLNVKGAYLHLLADMFISLGVVIAAVFIYWMQWLWLDPVVAIIIVTAILFGAWRLLRDSVNLLLGAVPHNVNLAAVRDYLYSIEGVKAVHDLHIWGLSTQENALTVHLVMPERVLNDEDYAAINHILEHDYHIHHVTIQVEKGVQENLCRLVDIC